MIQEITFEQRIYSFIIERLTVDEDIIPQKTFGKGSGYYKADFYLPKGCRALDIPVQSIIELKRKLQPDTLYLVHEMFKNHKESWGVDSLYILYSDRNHFSKELLDAYKQYVNEHFCVFSEDEFLKGNIIQKISAPIFETWKKKRSRIIMDAQYDFEQGHNTFFLGAGLGVDVKMPKWEELLDDLLGKAQANSHTAIGSTDYNDIDKSCGHSSLIMGRYIENGFGDMDEFKKQMHDSLYKNNPQPTSKLYEVITKAIMKGKVDQVITYNYDDLVETALINEKVPVHSIYDRSHYSGPEFPVYHVHGMIPQTRPIDSTPVLSEKEYHTLYKESFHWSNVVQLQALARTTCFFVGLSMNDPNLRRLLDISSNGIDGLNIGYSKPQPCHYAILERKPLNPAQSDPAKDAEHFAMQEKMMEDLGIRIIWYDYKMYNEIPNIIRRLW